MLEQSYNSEMYGCVFHKLRLGFCGCLKNLPNFLHKVTPKLIPLENIYQRQKWNLKSLVTTLFISKWFGLSLDFGTNGSKAQIPLNQPQWKIINVCNTLNPQMKYYFQNCFSAIQVAYPAFFNGLRKCSMDLCNMKGDTRADPTWWYAIASIYDRSLGIPGPDGIDVQYVEAYVMKDC